MKCFSLILLGATSSAFQTPSSSSSSQTIIVMTGGAMLSPVRRTSSIAYDDNDNADSKENYNRVDMWRKRKNLPSKPRFSMTALSCSASEVETSSTPMYTFGVLADVQYAPIPDGHSYSGNPRYYQHAKEAARHAAIHFQEEKVQCVVNLGDIVDGKCADVEKWGGIIDEEKKSDGCSSSSSVGHEAIDEVLEALSSYSSGRMLHTYGNHELYNLSRLELGNKLSIPFVRESTDELVGYYDHVLHEPQQKSDSIPWKLRFVVLDSYDICLLDRCAKTSLKRKAAHEILSKHNPNYPEQENSPEGLDGLSRRFVAFNGGVDKPQLEWLENSMKSARENGEKVIICSHQPVHPKSSFTTCLIWNYDDVLSIVRKYSDIVLASFSGHAHKGGYVRDEESGVHFRTFEAMLESPRPIRTYAFVDVWKDRLVVRGMGDCFSDIYDLDHLDHNCGM